MNNREIKFRVRDKEKWVYNCLIGQGIIPAFQVNDNFDVVPLPNAKVQQFTGLVDRNGKEIYEGDILKSIEDLDSDCCHGDVTTYIKYSEVKFKNGYFTSDEENPFFLCMNPNWFEVVGNIFENPKLLK